MTPRTRSASRAVALLLACALAACGDDGVTGPVRARRAQLAANEARWNAGPFAAGTYTLVQRRSCFCGDGIGEYQVRVQGDQIVEVTNVATGDVLPADRHVLFRTVRQLFDEVRTAIPRAGVLREVVYHGTLGYPAEVALDPVPNAVDDEITYLTTSVFGPPPG